jgi:hypothetical protein
MGRPAILIVLVGLSCARGDTPLANGSEGGACYPNGTCDTGLICSSIDICVSADPCANVACGGRGTCETDGADVTCRCDPGYQSHSLTCVPTGCIGCGNCTSIGCGPIAPVCPLTGVCWESPLPLGAILNTVWGSSENDIWVGGERGTLLHWDGLAWTFNDFTTEWVIALWGTGASDVWALLGNCATYRFDGNAWVGVNGGGSCSAHTGWSATPDDAWHTRSSELLRWDGDSWTVFQNMA